MSSHRGYSSNSGLLPSRPVFGGTDDSKNASSSSLSEQLQLSMDDIINTYLSECSAQDKAECVTRLSQELSKPLLGHHHHANRHERITIILNRIVNKSQENIQILSIIREAKITNLLVKWLKGESLPHGYSGVNTKKAIMMLLPNILHKTYTTLHQEWPLEFVTAYLWDVTYDGHWNDRSECICFTRIIRSILCDIEALNTHYHYFRLKLAAPFVSQANGIKKEAMFKYDTIKNDQITKFRLAMELCCYKEIRNEIYTHIERWFNLQNLQPHFQIKFINCVYATLQPDIYNDDKLFCDKLLRLNYGMHCRTALTKNLSFLFESFPTFYEMAINFILNIKPSEKQKFQLLLECIVDATPGHNLDLSQSRRKRKKEQQIEIEWNDSYAVTNEDDEDEDEDEEDSDQDEDVMDSDQDEYGPSIKMHHPSYTLGTQMASAREVHSHRKMCDETLKKFINVNKFDLCLFCESYLEHISEKSTTKVKKNGLTYLNNMAKHLIRAQYLMYRECKRDQNEIIEWKLDLMRAQDIITQSFVPLSLHFGFDNVCSLLFNFLLLSVYNGSRQMCNVKVIHFEDVITINEQKKSFQSIPVAMATLDTLFNINVQSMGLERSQIEQYLCLISLLLERGLRFVCDYKEYLPSINGKNTSKSKNKKVMLYALYSGKKAKIEDVLTKAMDVCKYFVASTLNVRRCMSMGLNGTGLSEGDMSVIEKYIHKLGHIDFFMEILLIFTLFGCMSLPKYLNVLLQFPTTSRLIHMLILQEWELPFTQKQIDINYEKHEETLRTFCHHFIAKEDNESDAKTSSNAPSVSGSPSKKGKSNAGILTKTMVKNLTILMYEDRLWNVTPDIISKLKQFEQEFHISKHIWKYYLNNELLMNILTEYDYAQIIPSYINHISRDVSIIHSQQLSDPILIVSVIFNIVQNQDKEHWRCLLELFRRIRVMIYHSNTPKQAFIKSLLQHMLSFDSVMHKTGRHSTTEILDFPHLIFSSICLETVPYIDGNAMKIQLPCVLGEYMNPCTWLFDLREIHDYFVDVTQCIIQLLTEDRYTHAHLNAYVTFAAKCVVTMTENTTSNYKAECCTLYTFIIVICGALLSYPLAFATLLQQSNMDTDIQRLVQYAMQHTRDIVPHLSADNTGSVSVLSIHTSHFTMLSLKDGDKSYQCPSHIIVCMLYIIAYGEHAKNGVSPWITFIVSQDLKLQIVWDKSASNYLQECLPDELRWKLLLKHDNLQLYCFMYRISGMPSLCNIVPFLLNHEYESTSSSSSNKTKSAIQMVSWICNDLSNENGRFKQNKDKQLFMKIIKPLIVHRANDNIAIWCKIMSQFKSLFAENDARHKADVVDQKHNVPMLMALFADNDDTNGFTTNDNGDTDDIKMKDIDNKSSENEELLHYLVAAFDSDNNNTNDNNVHFEEWSKLLTRLFCVESEEEKGNIIASLFEKLLNPDNSHNTADYTVSIVNLVNNHTPYMDRLLCYCSVDQEKSIRNNIKQFMSNNFNLSCSPYKQMDENKNEKVHKNQVNDWLNTLCHHAESNLNRSKTRKRNWSQMQKDKSISLCDEASQDLLLLSKLGGFGNHVMHRIFKNTNDDTLRYKVLSQLIASRNNMKETKDDTSVITSFLTLKSVQCAHDLHNLFDYNHVCCEEAIAMILNKMTAIKDDSVNDGMKQYEPPKKKPRKLKLILNKSPKSKTAANNKQSASRSTAQITGYLHVSKECYAECVADKLSDDPALFKLLLQMDDSIRNPFIEKCIEFMCDYFYSPIRGIFMVNQLHFILNEYPCVLLNVINVLAKHSKEKLIMNNNLKYLLKNREDWYFHHFAMLLCCINIENEYSLKTDIIKDLIDSMIVFLENSPLQIQHLNESVYLTSLLLIKLSKHYFHFFPNPQKIKQLGDRFKCTKMEKMWCLMQSLDRFHL